MGFQAKKDAKIALTQQGLQRKGSDSKFASFKIPSSDELSVKRVDPAKLEVTFYIPTGHSVFLVC